MYVELLQRPGFESDLRLFAACHALSCLSSAVTIIKKKTLTLTKFIYICILQINMYLNVDKIEFNSKESSQVIE